MGLVTLGYKVMETVGKNVIKLDFYKGFACQFATATCIMLGSYLGIPLSTTHCMVGSLFGIVVANKTQVVKRAYLEIRVAETVENNAAELEEMPDADIETLTSKAEVSQVKDENSINF